jgi:cobalt-zinc-cadmium efflux system membrane fusion protein
MLMIMPFSVYLKLLFRQSKILYFSGRFQLSFFILITALLLGNIPSVFAHAGHGNEFESGAESSHSPSGIEVEATTLKRLGIRVKPVVKEPMQVGIKTTGQIEVLPSQKVKVTSPIAGKIVQLLVEPGDQVEAGQPLAILASPELVDIRVESQQKQAEAQAEIKEAQANLELAQQNYQRQLKISESEISQAQKQLQVAQERYQREKSLVESGGVLEVAKENYQRQLEIAEAEIEQAQTELAVAQEQFDRDQELVESGALARRQMLESKANLAEAKAQLAKAKSQREVLEAQGQIKQAEVDLPIRDLQESQDKLAETQSQLIRANSRKEVLEAEAEVKRAEAVLQAAKSRLNLSQTAYQTRLEQLGNQASEDGTLIIKSPIYGTISEREITLGQSVEEAGQSLMTIQDNRSVWATGNLYEKDLSQIKVGQTVNVKVASVANQTFTGHIAIIATGVEGESRVVPVKAQIENSEGILKPGMFAELEIVTTQTSMPVLTIPPSSIIEANGKSIVYVKNGQSFEPAEVTLGQQFGQLVEVKNGLFEGDEIVIEGAMQLYAQSLRGSRQTDTHSHKNEQQPNHFSNSMSLPWWLFLPTSGVVAAGAFWIGKRSKPSEKQIPQPHLSVEPNSDLTNSDEETLYEWPIFVETHQSSPKD